MSGLEGRNDTVKEKHKSSQGSNPKRALFSESLPDKVAAPDLTETRQEKQSQGLCNKRHTASFLLYPNQL